MLTRVRAHEAAMGTAMTTSTTMIAAVTFTTIVTVRNMNMDIPMKTVPQLLSEVTSIFNFNVFTLITVAAVKVLINDSHLFEGHMVTNPTFNI